MYNSISKTIVSRKKVDLRYKEKGSIYFYSGKKRGKSGCKIIVYYKSLEVMTRNERIEDLPEGWEMLRIEFKGKRDKIVRELRKNSKQIKEYEANRFISNYSNTYTFNTCSNDEYVHTYRSSSYDSYFINNTKFGELPIMNIEEPSIVYLHSKNYKSAKVIDTIDVRYQLSIIKDICKELLLDKKRLTRAELFSVILEVDKFKSRTLKQTAINVVKYINGELDEMPVNEKRLKKFLKEILSCGIHYIYVDATLEPIMIGCS